MEKILISLMLIFTCGCTYWGLTGLHIEADELRRGVMGGIIAKNVVVTANREMSFNGLYR